MRTRTSWKHSLFTRILSRRNLHPGTMGLFLSCLLFLSVLPATGDDQNQICIEPGRSSVQIEQLRQPAGAGLLLTIRSSTGIGSARFTRTGARWPESIQVHFCLKGLEHAELIADETTLEWSVSSSPPHQIQQSVKTGTSAACPVKPDDPLWASIERGDHERGIRVVLPAALLKRNPAQLTLRWIDFYR